MKIFVLLVSCIFSVSLASAQLQATVVCPGFDVDILGGNINRQVYPKSTMGEIKKTFPCFTEVVEDTTGSKCKAVFYKDKGISFYTDRNYFEISDNFKGKLTPALMGASRSSLFQTLGYPKIKDTGWDAYQTEYGTLVLYYNTAGKINKIQISSKTTEALKLCQ